MRLFSLFIVITGSIVTSFIAIVFLLTFLSDDTQRSSFSHKIYLDEESGKMNELKIEPTESNRIHYLKSCEPKFQTKP